MPQQRGGLFREPEVNSVSIVDTVLMLRDGLFREDISMHAYRCEQPSCDGQPPIQCLHSSPPPMALSRCSQGRSLQLRSHTTHTHLSERSGRGK